MRNVFVTVGRAACFAGVLLAATAWSARAQGPATYMRALMLNLIGPAANVLWETVGARTLSDSDWARMKDAVARLSESATAVSAGGTSAAEIERAKSNEWHIWAGKFAETVSTAALAVDRKNQMALIAASDAIVEACEGCHTAFPSAAPN